jgi:hypothetical protein
MFSISVAMVAGAAGPGISSEPRCIWSGQRIATGGPRVGSACVIDDHLTAPLGQLLVFESQVRSRRGSQSRSEPKSNPSSEVAVGASTCRSGRSSRSNSLHHRTVRRHPLRWSTRSRRVLVAWRPLAHCPIGADPRRRCGASGPRAPRFRRATPRARCTARTGIGKRCGRPGYLIDAGRISGGARSRFT